MLQWAHENGCPWDEGTCEYAAQGGHLEVLQWARENGCPWDKETCSDAARGGHHEVLQWGISGVEPAPAQGGGRRRPAWRSLARRRVPVGRWDVPVRGAGRPPGGPCDPGRGRAHPVGRETCAKAADTTVTFGCMQWALPRTGPGKLHVRPRRVRREATWGVAVGASERVPVGRGTCPFAAQLSSTLEVLKWAPLGARGTSGRARSRRRGATLEMLQWGVRTGALGPDHVPRARHGKATWRCLQWARQNGCRGTSDVLVRGARPPPWRCCSGRVRTGARGTRGRARPRRRRPTWRSASCCSGRVQNGCPWNERTYSEAAEGGHLEVLSGRVRTGAPSETRRRGPQRCRPYLIKHGCPDSHVDGARM